MLIACLAPAKICTDLHPSPPIPHPWAVKGFLLAHALTPVQALDLQSAAKKSMAKKSGDSVR
jgi:hypothetical protein